MDPDIFERILLAPANVRVLAASSTDEGHAAAAFEKGFVTAEALDVFCSDGGNLLACSIMMTSALPAPAPALGRAPRTPRTPAHPAQVGRGHAADTSLKLREALCSMSLMMQPTCLLDNDDVRAARAGAGAGAGPAHPAHPAHPAQVGRGHAADTSLKLREALCSMSLMMQPTCLLDNDDVRAARAGAGAGGGPRAPRAPRAPPRRSGVDTPRIPLSNFVKLFVV
ncbi:hypothetical protein ACJJTC_016457 [Scirpophaga incertulas]